MPAVHNKHHKSYPQDAIYIGRPTIWGNPFSHLPNTQAEFRVGTRKEAVERYVQYLQDNPSLLNKAKEQLAGRDLVCWCAPALCHGHVLVRLVNDLPLPLDLDELLPPKPPKPPSA